jgi:uncharacterized membrane protein YdjX (TVP38/TMEM64 family)
MSLGSFAPILACFLIMIESILPVLPLSVFITINFYYLGSVVGFIISWVFTCLGCFISFKLCRTKFKIYVDRFLNKKDHQRINKLMKSLNNLKIEQLTVIIAVPFTPAFLVNIASGLSNMEQKKYLISIVVGKVFLVYFWGFIGTSLIESFKNPLILIKIVIYILLAFVISKLVNKKFNV